MMDLLVTVQAPTAAELLRKGVNFDPGEFRGGPRRRVMFVVPPGNVKMNYGRLAAAATELPWLGMAYIAAAVRAVGHPVLLRDYEVLRLGYDDVAADVRAFHPDVVAMALFINNVDRCLRIAALVKAIDPRIRVVFGGPQATIFPEQTLADPHVDIVVQSEAEISMCRLLATLDDRDAVAGVPGLWFNTGSEVVRTPRQPLIENLDSVPVPALDLYPMDRYYPAVHIWGQRVANMVTSRGCPYECTFCEAKMTFGRTFRFHSPERVVDDMNYMHRTWGVDSFQFYDDIFTTNRKRVLALCETLLSERTYPYQWMCFTRTDLVDRELLAAMKRAGCYLIVFGCESGSPRLLKLIKKNLTVERNYEGIRLTREAGIRTLSSFMLGLPTETAEETEATIRFAVRSDLDFAVFPITEPYPGTEMWNDAVENGYFIAADTFKNHLLTNFDRVWVPTGRTRAELEGAARGAFRRFYLRPRQVVLWLESLRHVPLSRALRYLWAGVSYFVVTPFDRAVNAYRGRGSRYS